MRHENSIWMEALSSYARVCARSIFLQIAWISLFFFAPAFAASALPNDFQLLHSTTTGICLPAIERLGQSRDVSAAPVLISALTKEKRPLVRRYLVEALGLLRDSSATPALIQTLNDSDAQVRQSAVIALEQIGDDNAQAALLAQSQHEHDYGTKARLVGVLKRSGNSKADDGLKTLAQDSDPDIQAAATKALATRAQKKSMPKGVQ